MPETVDLHKENIQLYRESKLCILPQVYNELHSHGIDVSEGLGNMLQYDYVLEDENMNYMLDLYTDLYDYTTEVLAVYEKIHNKYEPFHKVNEELLPLFEEYLKLKKIISDAYYALERFGPKYDYLISILTSKNEFSEGILSKITGHNFFTGKTLASLHQKIQTLDINYQQEKTTEDGSVALGNIVEKTVFGTREYKHGYTHKDILRLTGNFTHDYKGYKNKGEKQKQKVGKDAIVFGDILFSLPTIGLSLESDDIVFISSDYPFVKELRSFFDDVNNGNLFSMENYNDLSTRCIETAKRVAQKAKIIKLDISNLYFENDKGVSSRQLLDILA